MCAATEQGRPGARPATVAPGTPAVGRRLVARRAVHLGVLSARHGSGLLLDLAGFHDGWHWQRPNRRGVGRVDLVARRSRLVLEDLGPTFVKLGQMLSTRDDLLPSAFQVELARLQDAAPPEPPGTVERVVEAELGRRVHDVFAAIDPEPIAAASIGQAHNATLADGTEVVVKFRRPSAAELVEVDLTVLERAAAALARWVRPLRRIDLPGLVSELARTLREELDYVAEAANAERIGANLASDARVHVPRVYRAASTRQIITLERIVGIKVSDLGALDAAGVDRAALAQHVVDVVLSMVFDDGFFHADPHPGNLFAEPDGRLGLVDFGMVGRLAPDTRARLARLFLATAAADAPALTDELLGLGTATRAVDRAVLTRDLADILHRVTAVPVGELRLGPLLHAELTVMRRHHLRMPPELAMLVKTAAMTEGLAAQLDPGFMILPAFAPYAARLMATPPTPPRRDALRREAPRQRDTG